MRRAVFQLQKFEGLIAGKQFTFFQMADHITLQIKHTHSHILPFFCNNCILYTYYCSSSIYFFARKINVDATQCEGTLRLNFYRILNYSAKTVKLPPACQPLAHVLSFSLYSDTQLYYYIYICIVVLFFIWFCLKQPLAKGVNHLQANRLSFYSLSVLF